MKIKWTASCKRAKMNTRIKFRLLSPVRKIKINARKEKLISKTQLPILSRIFCLVESFFGVIRDIVYSQFKV